jgi:lactoylglutathione lyase
MGLIHTCIRVRDIDASLAFYKQLGFEVRGRLNFDTAYNVYLGLPGDRDRLELTVNIGHDEPYELGDGYNHIAITVSELDSKLEELAEAGIEPDNPPYKVLGKPIRIAFVRDPDRQLQTLS